MEQFLRTLGLRFRWVSEQFERNLQAAIRNSWLTKTALNKKSNEGRNEWNARRRGNGWTKGQNEDMWWKTRSILREDATLFPSNFTKIHGESPHRTKIQKMNFVEKNILFNRITKFIQLWRFIKLICIIQLRPGKLRAALMCNSLVDVFAN